MTDQDITILCVDDEANVLKALRRLFMDDDYEILTAESGEEGLEELDNEPGVQVVVSDYRMPGMDGVAFLKEVCERRPDTVRIVLSGYADTAAIVSAINEGQIYKFIPKPWNDDELRVTIAKAVELYFLQQENADLTKELQASNEELKTINENLENMVEERSQEILFQNKVLANSHVILNTLPFGILGIDLNGIIVQFNSKCAELFDTGSLTPIGLDADDELPDNILQILAKLSNEGDIVHDRVVLGDTPLQLTAVYMKSDQGQEGKILVLNADCPRA
jgi:two-component system NtrC family sensor kinase